MTRKEERKGENDNRGATATKSIISTLVIFGFDLLISELDLRWVSIKDRWVSIKHLGPWARQKK